ncbi:MAG: cupin domain-containing protein [Bryobacteraceae bacterium]
MDAFLANDYGQKSVYVPGTPGKFSALLPWPVLNDILEQHRLEPPDLRLMRAGKPVPAERYVSFQRKRRTNDQRLPRLKSAELTRELREGATLVIDHVDELHRPIRRLAESLEHVFRVRIQVNSYSGWRTSHGFDLHWDDHDVFILQVAGRKHWKVYGATRPYPVARDVERAADPPSEVLWERVLQDGDLLYIPRGWWHVATPLDEPTLHLTIGVSNPTGLDFLSWFVDRLRTSDIVRQDVPHLHGVTATRAYANRLWEAVVIAWRLELIQEYMAHVDANSAPRPHFALPWSATDDVLPPAPWRVQWTGKRPVHMEASGDDIVIAMHDRRWKFAASARPLLELLVSGRECTNDDLDRIATGFLGSRVVREFVRELAANGLVVVR